MVWIRLRAPRASIERPRAVVVTGASSGIGRASRYAPSYAPVVLGRYRGFDEQEPTIDEGGGSEIGPKRSLTAEELQVVIFRLPRLRLLAARPQ